ncbi:MAG: hypothetical protein HQK82_11370, partial [Desulfovibrionaceae bacterium]|nr:hypothetical protein [Desulfovibrionaceae bacterium]
MLNFNVKFRFAAMVTLGGDTSKLPVSDLLEAASQDWRIRQAAAQAIAS